MTQAISNAYRIAAAEAAICDHNTSLRRHEESQVCCTEEDATDLLQSLALWAETNGICLRLQKAVYAGDAGECAGDA
jgi:hypothetical protein